MTNVVHTNVEIERFDARGKIVRDFYSGVAGYSILKGELTIIDLEGNDVWTYADGDYETLTHWEVVEDGA